MYGSERLNAARALVRAFSSEEEVSCEDVDALNAKIEEQNLVLQTLVALLLEKGLVSEAEFRACADEIDALDGRRDGKLTLDKSPMKTSPTDD